MKIKSLPKYRIGDGAYLNFSCGSRVLLYILDIDRVGESYLYHVDMTNYNVMENVWINERIFSMKINRNWFNKQINS